MENVLTILFKLLLDALVYYEIQLTANDGALVVRLKKRPVATRITFFELGKEITMLILKDTQKTKLSVAFTDAKGAAAVVDGKPVWAVSADGVVVLTPSDDGLSCDVAGDLPGSVQVNVTADADLGEGVKPIIGTLDVQVLAGDAAVATITSGEVVDQ